MAMARLYHKADQNGFKKMNIEGVLTISVSRKYRNYPSFRYLSVYDINTGELLF